MNDTTLREKIEKVIHIQEVALKSAESKEELQYARGYLMALENVLDLIINLK